MSSRNFIDWLNQGPGRAPGSHHNSRMSMLPGVLQKGDLKSVFQPIVDLQSLRVFAYESLLRSTSPDFKGPPALLDDAIKAQCIGAVGRAVRELAVLGCDNFPLFLNVHPEEFAEGWLVQPNDPVFVHTEDVYLEVTESVPLSHFEYCHSVLAELRSKGVKVVVDDLGAGYSNLRYIADLAPDVVKLDRSLVTNAGENRRLRLLVENLVQLCQQMGAKVVCEGLETEDEVKVAQDAGADYGQGYFFARPAYPPPLFDRPLQTPANPANNQFAELEAYLKDDLKKASR